jgi:hypothetical protein
MLLALPRNRWTTNNLWEGLGMSSSVSVTYTFNPNTAAVTILVERNGAGQTQFVPAFPALSSGDWIVTWNLQAGTGVSNPKFAQNDGIKILQMPPLLSVSDSHRVSDTQWQASFTNQVQSANLATYDIAGTADEGPFGEVVFIHDPAIAVTPDPPPGG